MSSHHGRNAFDKTRSDYERKLERQRQLANFDKVATADVPDEEEASIVSYFPSHDGVKKKATTTEKTDNGNNNDAPKGAIESARRFLWDEDGDDDYEAPSQHQKQNMTGDSASSRASMFFAKTGIEQDRRRLKDIRGFESPGVSDPSDNLHDVNLNSSFRLSFVPRRSESKESSILAPVGACCMAVMDPILHPCSCTKRQKMMSVCVSLFMVLLIVGTVTVAMVGNDSSSEPSGTEIPNAPPPEDTEANNRSIQIRNFILNTGITSKGEFKNNKSPQHKAVAWMVDTDEMQVDVGDSELLPRYALATFFFATHEGQDPSSPNADDWETSTNWMTKNSICSWYGIQCVNRESESRSGAATPDSVHVVHMILNSNKIKGKIPCELSALETLKDLQLKDNSLVGSIPMSFGKAKHLVNLELESNGLTGSIPTEIAECVGLRNLHLNNNTLKGSVPAELSALNGIHSFDLSENHFDGNLPDLSNYSRLQRLKLDGNSFGGTISAESGKLSELEEMTLENNKIHGSIPPELGGLTHLEVFSIGNNNIDGPIPNTVNEWKKMKDLRLNHNKISGPIPLQLTHLGKLEFLHLEGNQMTGTIPKAISKLSQLSVFRFYDNKFTGIVPEAVCNLKTKDKPEFLAEDCGKNDGMIACSCCQECTI